jgi:hypothetical protein
MNTMRSPRGNRARWTTLALLCGAMLTMTAAAPAQAQTIGKVIGVPADDLANFQQVNASPGVDQFGQPLPPNDVTVLNTSPVVGDPFNTAIVTVSITDPASGQGASQIYFPIDANGEVSPLYALINANDSFANSLLINTGDTPVLLVNVGQSDTGNLDLTRTRFLLVPADRVGSLEVTNPSVEFTTVHIQQTSVNSQILAVALVGIDVNDAGNIQVPSQALADLVQALNSNVVVQNVAGSSLFAITTISVS